MTRVRMFVVSLFALGACALAGACAQAADLRVGADPACTHATIQDALDDATDSDNTIRIANSQTYTAQHFSITGKHVTLDGGYADCAQSASTGVTTIDGSGHTGDSVISITQNSSVVLQNLTVSHGHEGSENHGGGIFFQGTGSLTLRAISIVSNYAGYGGGIHFEGNGGHAELHLEQGTLIVSNTAQNDGGGIDLVGDARLYALADGILIFNNEAIDGQGGGIEVFGKARADIGSPGLGGAAVISGNRASRGGGIAVTAGSDAVFKGDEYAIVRLLSTDAARPVRIDDNFASVAGGGIYTKAFVDDSPPSVIFANALLCGTFAGITGNESPQGAAVFVDEDIGGLGNQHGSAFGLQAAPDGGDFICNPEPPAQLGGLPCPTGASCNLITGNRAADGNGTATAGAVVHATFQSKFAVDRTEFRSNQGGALLTTNGGLTSALANCLIAANGATQNLIAAGALHIDGCTLAGNTIGASAVLSMSENLRLHNSIVWQPGKTSLQQSGGSLDIADVLASEVASLGGVPNAVSADPRFVDPATGDFHPQAASPAVDFSATVSGVDLEGHARGTDLARVPNLRGPADIGAYERVDIDNLVRNATFDADLHLWNVTATEPGHAFWDGTQNDVGATASGSVELTYQPINGAPLGQPVEGLSQCVHVPGPGDYSLTGFGRLAGSNSQPFHNAAALHWKLRRNSDTCTGAIDGEGRLSFPYSNPIAWRAPLAAQTLSVADGAFTRDTTIEIVPELVSGTVAGDAGAWFDGISLTPTDADVIFANGFDID